MRKLALIFSCFLLINCNKKQDTCPKPKQFEMYQMSEMAGLMEQMYAENTRLKQRILNKENLGKFPDYFLKIHSAKFTDESDNDSFFVTSAQNFIVAQKAVYIDSINPKKSFNNMVISCITCHEAKCGGPIVKIKKLYIP